MPVRVAGIEVRVCRWSVLAFAYTAQEVHPRVKVRIAVTSTGREIELEIDDADAFIKEVEEAFASEAPLLWVNDTKKNRVAIPVAKIGYVEVETDKTKQQVGFG